MKSTTGTTNRRGVPTAAMALLGGLLTSQLVSAQNSESVTVDVADCIELESATDRLACFEARVDAVLEEQDAGEAAGADEPVAVTRNRGDDDARADRNEPTRSERRAQRRAAREQEKIAQRQARLEQTAADLAERQARAAEAFSGTIAALDERLPDSYVITLDNGQIWEQTAPKRYPLHVGLDVEIYPSQWGPSYRLTGQNLGSFVQVRRVK